MSVPQAQMMQLPRRWPLAAQPSNRGSTTLKDARIINAILEKDPTTQEWQVQKRPGYSLYNTLANGNGGNGVYYWAPAAAGIGAGLYSIFNFGLNSVLYRDSAFISNVPTLNIGQVYLFAEMQSGTPALLMLNPAGSIASNPLVYTQNGSTIHQPAIPSTGGRLVGVAALDQTAYVMDDLCNIYGSAVGDPSTWNALNVIPANSISGNGRGLVQILQYLFALKSNSLELFIDNGSPPPGSPLIQIKEGNSNYGCVTSASIQVIDNVLIYLSANKNSSPFLVRVDGTAVTPISTPPIERLFGVQTFNTLVSWAFRIAGHRLYGLTSFGNNLTLVYDMDENFWYQWTDVPSPGVAFTPYPFVSTSAQSGLAGIYGQTFTGKNVYAILPADLAPTDAGGVSPVDIYTPSTDFDTRRRKTLHRMYFRGDQTPGSILQIRRSNDDFKSWSNFRKVDLGRKNPYIDNEGTFIKRAYHFHHACPTDFRLRSADLQMDRGTI